MEANALIPKLRRLGGSRVALAPDLIALLDLDIRVVIAWNTGSRRISTCGSTSRTAKAPRIYSNRDTAIGGRLSEDMMMRLRPRRVFATASAGRASTASMQMCTRPIPSILERCNDSECRLIHDFGRTERTRSGLVRHRADAG